MATDAVWCVRGRVLEHDGAEGGQHSTGERHSTARSRWRADDVDACTPIDFVCETLRVLTKNTPELKSGHRSLEHGQTALLLMVMLGNAA